jgi:radical SAM superfamily enzyme YgiQ (UPF0313 family)
MKVLLAFPPGWMQFGPYLSIPLLKGWLKQHGIEATPLDLNIEFYDWVLSPHVLAQAKERLRVRERQASLGGEAYARLCKALLTCDDLADRIEGAKATLRSVDAYLDPMRRGQAKADICAALNAVESSYDKFRLTLNQIAFGSCGLEPRRVLSFLGSEENLVRQFYAERVRPLIEGTHYDLIGLSLPAWEQLVPALTIAQCMREQVGTSAHICMGGNYVTRLVGTWGNAVHPYTELIDSFSVFEGEMSLLRLVETLAGPKDLSKVPNLVFREGDQLRRTQGESMNVNAVPPPDFDGLPLGKYLVPEPVLPLFTSRSCPYKCSFCTIPYASSEFRQRSADNVARDLEVLQQKYRASLFTFVDETLTVPSLSGVARAINERGLKLYWYGETRFHRRFDRSLARELFRSGCRKLQFGLESYNQRVLNLMKKGVKVEDIQPNIEACLSEGIAVHLFTFTGFPGETEAEARSTYEFAQRMLELSRSVYNNPYSSVGSGAFNLEVYSDVYLHPERYGVRFDASAATLEGDQMFELDYEVSSGLSRREAAELVREFDRSAIFHEACSAVDSVWWQSLWGNETNEDEDFLLYALGERESQPAVGGPEEARPVAHLWSSADGARISLPEYVLTGRFSANFLKADGAPNPRAPVVTFYDRRRDRVVNLPAAIGESILACLEQGALPTRLDAGVHEAINLLMRHELLTVQGQGVDNLLSANEFKSRDEAWLLLNPDIHILRLQPNSLELFDTVTQDIYTVNAVVAWLASMLREHPQPLQAFITEAVRQEPTLSRLTVRSALEQLIDARVVLATRRPYRTEQPAEDTVAA